MSGPRRFDRDLGARVAGSDYEHRARLQLLWVAVLASVQLDDRGIELGRIGGDSSLLVWTGRNHDLLRFDRVIAEAEPEAVRPSGQASHPRAQTHPALGMRRIRLQVSGHLVPGRERAG